jgi:NAD(P)-dependent dehydrogenase (short-subunit alcohol dehydrogenase family)
MGAAMNFDGDVVIVTGGAGGLGRSQAAELGRRGARVVVNDLGGSPRGGGSDPTMASVVADEICSAGGDAIASTVDIASTDGPRLLVEQALDTWGRVDAVVHNAAILRNAHFENVSDTDYDDIMHVNLRGTFRTVRAVYRAMKDRGGGRILTVTSASGLCGAFGQSVYAATKMGVIGLTRSIAWEGTRFGIKANVIAPAAFDSRIYAEINPDGDAVLTGRPPELQVSLEAAELMGLYTASRVTPLALALLHDSCPVTAEVYSATGGYFTRFALCHTEGTLLGVEPTVDDVVAHFGEIRGEGTVTNELDGEALVWGLQSFAPRLKPLLASQNPG